MNEMTIGIGAPAPLAASQMKRDAAVELATVG